MIEFVDVLDPLTSERTGTAKPKADAHRDGDWHRAAHVWIVTPDNHILLQKRSLQKENHPGLWDVSSAGHVSAGESALDAAMRETGEELGITVDPSELVPIGVTRESHVLNGGAYLDNEVHEVFLVRRDVDLAMLRLQPGEVDDARLVTIAEFLQLIRDGAMVDHAHEYALLQASI